MNSERLLKLADFLETVPRKQFNMTIIAEERDCGFAGCAIGWAIKGGLFDGLTYDQASDLTVYEGEIGYHAIDTLFECNCWSALFVRDGTPKQVARRIRAFVKSGGKVP